MKTIQELLQIAKEKGIKSSYLNTLINGYRGKITDAKNGKTTLTENEIGIISDYLLGQKEKSLSEEDKLIADINCMLSSKSKDELLYYKDLISRLAKDK